MSKADLAIQRIDGRVDDIEQSLRLLRERLSPRGDIVSESSRQRTVEVFGQPLTPQEVVCRICNDVRQRGLDAVLDYTQKFDLATLSPDTIRVTVPELQEAHQGAAPEFLATIRRIRQKISEFQEAIRHHDVQLTRKDGTILCQRYLPLERVGLCVPGGAASYPSTVLMTAVPAQVAGVRELVVVAPPTPFGAYNSDLLATCHELGIDEVLRIGGAQAVAAMAYGIDGLRKVDKIVGPGNLFVALAKKQVYGEVDIDAIAGPSEVVVVADDTARPDFIAADLLAQAEHAPGSSVLVTWSPTIWNATYDQLVCQVARLSREDATRHSLEQFGALILVSEAADAINIVNLLAPEHLHLEVDNAEAMIAQMPHAGAAFLGNFSPVAMGDYVAGPSHVLPTGGTARWASGLTANDFQRSGSVIQFTEEGLRAAADDVRQMADKEGLTAHRTSIDIRLVEHP